MSLFANLVKNAVEKVQERNRNNPNINTADGSVFDKLKDKFEEVKNNVDSRRQKGGTNLLDQLRDRIDQVKRDNEANPNVETADNEVFDDMKRELDELKAKIAAEEQAEADARLADLRAQIKREEEAEADARMADLQAQIKQEEEAKAEAARRQREAEEEAERIRIEAERKRNTIPTIPTLDDFNINQPTVPTINTPNIPTINPPSVPTINTPKVPSLDDLNINQPSIPDMPKIEPRVRSIDVTPPTPPTPPPPSPKPSFPQQPTQPRSVDVTPPTPTPAPTPPQPQPQPTTNVVPPSTVQNAPIAMTDSMGGSLQLRAKADMGSPMTQVFVPDRSQIRVLGFSSHSINLDGKDVRFALVDFNGQQGWTFESYLRF